MLFESQIFYLSVSEKASHKEKFNQARYYMEIPWIYRFKSVTHMNSSKLDAEDIFGKEVWNCSFQVRRV